MVTGLHACHAAVIELFTDECRSVMHSSLA